MKLSTMIILMLVISFSITIFDGVGTIQADEGVIAFYNQTSGNAGLISDDGQSSTKLWDFLKDPGNWKESTLMKYMLYIVTTVLVTGAGLALLTKAYAPDTYLFGPWFIIILGFGSIPCWQLFNFLQREMSSFMCDPDVVLGFCYFPTLIAVLFTGALAMTWILTCINSWRTGSQ